MPITPRAKAALHKRINADLRKPRKPAAVPRAQKRAVAAAFAKSRSTR